MGWSGGGVALRGGRKGEMLWKMSFGLEDGGLLHCEVVWVVDVESRKRSDSNRSGLVLRLLLIRSGYRFSNELFAKDGGV